MFLWFLFVNLCLSAIMSNSVVWYVMGTGYWVAANHIFWMNCRVVLLTAVILCSRFLPYFVWPICHLYYLYIHCCRFKRHTRFLKCENPSPVIPLGIGSGYAWGQIQSTSNQFPQLCYCSLKFQIYLFSIFKIFKII